MPTALALSISMSSRPEEHHAVRRALGPIGRLVLDFTPDPVSSDGDAIGVLFDIAAWLTDLAGTLDFTARRYPVPGIARRMQRAAWEARQAAHECHSVALYARVLSDGFEDFDRIDDMHDLVDEFVTACTDGLARWCRWHRAVLLAEDIADLVGGPR